MKPREFDYQRPATIEHAIELLAEHGGEARVIAGGQSLGPMLNLRLASPEILVDISKLSELTQVQVRGDRFFVGAAVRHADIEDGVVREATPGFLDRVAGGIAYRAVRNRGTIGGSLAHADPAGDWLPVLIALDAVGVARGSKGVREIPIAGLVEGVMTTCLAFDEILTGVLIPRLPSTARWGHCKFCRKPGEFADAIATVVMDRERNRCRVVLAQPVRPPLRLDQTAQIVATLGGLTDGSQAAVRDAVASDLGTWGISADADPYLFRLAAVAVARAVQQAFDR